MKIVDPSVELLDPKDFASVYQFIEKIGRTCYKSEDKITDDSAAKFIKGLVNRQHWAMLEHGYIYMRISNDFIDALQDTADTDKAFLHICGNKLTANMRAMYQLIFNSSFPNRDILEDLKTQLQTLYPEVFGIAMRKTSDTVKKTVTSFMLMTREGFIASCEDEHDTEALHMCLPHTILFHVDRGVTHEIVRHRPASYAQESTRYCNYQKGKFGSEIVVVKPAWAIINTGRMSSDKQLALYHAWKTGCEHAETDYMNMVSLGATAQEARSLLPHAVKADIIVTAVEAEWEHILNLRAYGTTGAPQPDMRHCMTIAGTLLRGASNGRLYPNDYIYPEDAPAAPKYYYVFAPDKDGNLSPVVLDKKYPVTFTSKDKADEFIASSKDNANLVCITGLNMSSAIPTTNVFLDTLKTHLIMDGLTVEGCECEGTISLVRGKDKTPIHLSTVLVTTD